MSDIEVLKDLLDNHEDLYTELMTLFKEEAQALIWLINPKAPLCDQTPISLLGDSEGKEKVMEMLYRIKTGDMS